MSAKSAAKSSVINLERLVENVPAMIAVYDIRSGEYLYVNKAVRKLLGYSPKDFMSQGMAFVSTLVYPGDYQRILDENQQVLVIANKQKTKGVIASFEYRMRHKKGHWVWLKTDGSIYGRDTNGNVQQVLNVSVDITERKQAEQRLEKLGKRLEESVQERSERLALAVEGSKLGIWELDPSTNKLTWTKRLLRMYGLDPVETEITFKRYLELIHPDDHKFMSAVTQKALETGKSYRVEHRIKWPDGSVHWLLSQGKAFIHEGKPIKMSGTSMDIDNLKKTQAHRRLLELKTKALTMEREQLVALNQAKDEFISLASHQLRTPATGVKQYVGMLLGGYAGKLTKDQKLMLHKAYEGNERQIQIINSLLLVARVDAGKVRLSRKLTNLTKLLEEAVHEQRGEIDKRKQEVELKLPNKLMAYMDSGYLRMVLDNILNNASKYSYDGQKILITGQSRGGRAIIKISDEGVGIARQDQSKLYQKFGRIENPRTSTVEGNGLGLYWSKKIVDLHEGTMTVKSDVGKGTTFTINLPTTSIAVKA